MSVRTIGFNYSKKYLLKSIFWVLAIFLGILQTWANRYSVWMDVLSYLDIGDAYLRGDWNAAINACWSPLYSWLLGLALFAFKPSPYWELLVVKGVNFLIYLLTIVCFDFFLNELIRYYQKKIIQNTQNESLKVPQWVWIVLGYTLFIWASVKWLVVYRDTPDMVVTALVYLAAGIVLRIYTSSPSWFNFIALGMVLGFGYLSKSSMFPLAFVFLVTSLFSVGNLRRALPRVLVALLIFTIISAPFIAALSLQKGRLTFGDAGKLNYAWYVSPQVPDLNWQGLPPGSGIPKHPTRKIFNYPEAYEFSTPVNGTFPLWYDPSYWNEGLKPQLNLSKQVKCLAANTSFCYKLFLGSLIFSYLILVCISGSSSLILKNLIGNWRLLIPAVAGLCGFMVLTYLPGENQPWGFVQTRYIAPFIVLLFAGVFSSVHLPDSKKLKQLILSLTIFALVINGGILFYRASKDLATIIETPEHIQWQIANSLSQVGIQPGEKVAILGQEEYYWARLAKVKIIASIPDVKDFWIANIVDRAEVLKTIEKTGARAVVQRPGYMTIPDTSTVGWQEIGNTRCYFYLFKK